MKDNGADVQTTAYTPYIRALNWPRGGDVDPGYQAWGQVSVAGPVQEEIYFTFICKYIVKYFSYTWG